jgi:hypothetical protein
LLVVVHFIPQIQIDSPTKPEKTLGDNLQQKSNSEKASKPPKHSPSRNESENVTSLEMFQEQRLLHTKRLKKEIIKLERMEHSMAANAIRSEKVQKPILLHKGTKTYFYYIFDRFVYVIFSLTNQKD